MEVSLQYFRKVKLVIYIGDVEVDVGDRRLNRDLQCHKSQGIVDMMTRTSQGGGHEQDHFGFQTSDLSLNLVHGVSLAQA